MKFFFCFVFFFTFERKVIFTLKLCYAIFSTKFKRNSFAFSSNPFYTAAEQKLALGCSLNIACRYSDLKLSNYTLGQSSPNFCCRQTEVL